LYCASQNLALNPGLPCTATGATAAQRSGGGGSPEQNTKRRAVIGLLLLLQLACLVVSVPTQPGGSGPVRIALYCSGGASSCKTPTCCEPQAKYLSTLTTAAQMAFGDRGGFTVANLTAAAVPQLTPSQYDVVVFPGGSGNGQAAAVTPAGLVALRKFVAAGKGYIGTCGGSFLGLQHVGFYLPAKHTPCGDVSSSDKTTQPHCAPATQEPWDRGDGDVLVEFTQAGLAQVRNVLWAHF
jgi:putative intracellular protease/amidase